jgi:hypothetical protein
MRLPHWIPKALLEKLLEHILSCAAYIIAALVIKYLIGFMEEGTLKAFLLLIDDLIVAGLAILLGANLLYSVWEKSAWRNSGLGILATSIR